MFLPAEQARRYKNLEKECLALQVLQKKKTSWLHSWVITSVGFGFNLKNIVNFMFDLHLFGAYSITQYLSVRFESSDEEYKRVKNIQVNFFTRNSYFPIFRY